LYSALSSDNLCVIALKRAACSGDAYGKRLSSV
jgi:hypothetical protein